MRLLALLLQSGGPERTPCARSGSTELLEVTVIMRSNGQTRCDIYIDIYIHVFFVLV
jgi:hypothetical protein